MVSLRIILLLLGGLCLPMMSQAQTKTASVDDILAFVYQLPPLDSLIEQAIDNSAMLRSKDALISIKQHELARIKHDWLNLFALRGNVGYGNSFVDVTQSNLVDGVVSNVNTMLFNVGVSVNISPAYWIERKHEVDIRASYLKYASSLKEESAQIIAQQVTKAYIQLEYYRDVFIQSNAGLESNRATNQLAEKKFLEGEIDVALYNDVKLKSVKLQLEVESNKRNLKQAYFNLVQLVGLQTY